MVSESWLYTQLLLYYKSAELLKRVSASDFKLNGFVCTRIRSLGRVMEETEALKAMWPANGPDSLEDICLRFIARNLSLIAEQGKARLPTTGDFVDVSSSVEDHSVGNCVDGGGAEFNGSSSVDPEITTCYHVRPGIHLQKSVCDRLLAILIEEEEEPKELTYEKLSIFSDRQATLLSQADLRFVADHSLVMGLKMLSVQPLTELTMPCVWRCLPIIKQFKNLRSLRLEREPVTNAVDAFIQGQLKGSTENIHSVGSQVDGTPLFSVDAEYYKLTCPNLRRLVLHNLHFRVTPIRDLSFNSMMITCLLAPLERLSHLSLSMCRLNLEELTCLGNLACLVSLNLSGVKINDFPAVLGNLQPLQNLQHLDLSQGIEDESPVIYTNADGVLKSLVSIFPSLVSIDISGTNLAGFETPRVVSHRLLPKQKDKEKRQVTVELQNGEEKEEAKPEGREEITCKAEEEIRCSIPGLENRYLEFLGLLGCAYNACSRKHIPAKRVTGDTDSAQVVLAVQVYIDNHLLLIRALNDLFNLFRISSVTNHRQALEGVLAAMKAYPKDSSIQIAGSASLFYIAKGDHKQFITYQHKRDLVNLLLAAMYEHCFDQTMMRNACLTLCHLNLPGDVMFCYERLVKQLLDMLKYDYRDEFIHRLGIFLLNCLACQVDGKEKELVGRMGAVETMLQIISRKLRGQDCDDVLEVAWSTLWNVTDETPTNCQKFLSKGGMMLFVSCLQKFSDKAELLRNMMGLMGNIAEVDHLRKHLMTEEYVEIFSGLLESESDGIEVSYNACGVLSHLCFDGPSAWILESPSRKDVMERMKAAIKRWPLQSRRNINYRSFEPILRLVNHYDTPIVQHWACWALCNLTAVTPEKYCRLLERENGRVALERLMKDPRPDADIKQLAQRTLDQLDNKVSPAGQVSEDESVDEIDGNEEEEEVVEFEGEEEEEEEGMELEDERHMDDDDEHLEEGGDEAMEDQH